MIYCLFLISFFFLLQVTHNCFRHIWCLKLHILVASIVDINLPLVGFYHGDTGCYNADVGSYHGDLQSCHADTRFYHGDTGSTMVIQGGHTRCYDADAGSYHADTRSYKGQGQGKLYYPLRGVARTRNNIELFRKPLEAGTKEFLCWLVLHLGKTCL